ncbi:MAG: S9 family peptidase [Cytophagaceae bacterium]|nr:S9 family peptidase [Gemmatimonadaceae bacterium]
MQSFVLSCGPRQLCSAGRRFAVLGAVLLSACSGKEEWRPPETRLVTVTDTLHGVPIADPYRWLEDQASPEVLLWISKQESHADSVLGPTTPWRDSVHARLTQLMDVPAVGAPRKAGNWEYFTLRKRGELVGSIYRRKAPATPSVVSPDGDYESVLDAMSIRDDGTTSVGLEGFSNDGSLMIYSIRDGGTDETSIHVRDLATGRDLPDSLRAALYGGVSLAPDGKGLYFVHRSRTEGPRFKYHRLGADTESDSTIFGAGYAPTAFLNASTVENGKYRMYTVGHGWARNEVFLQDTKSGELQDLTKGLTGHFSPQFVDGSLLVRTDYEAPRGRVVKVDMADPSPAKWKDVIPQRDSLTLDGFTTIDGKLYVTWIADVSHRITVHDMSGRPTGEVALPPHASANIRGFGKGVALLTVNRFSNPTETWRVNLATGERTLWEQPDTPFDTSAVEVKQVWYTSKDGTRAPMYLLQKRGAVKNANTPVLLSGYGGFTLSLMPRFDARAAWWVEQGGIFAQATLRGGNEYGETWHQGGMLRNKQHVFDDFIAAGQFLVDSGYTSPSHLAIRGGSNGGLLMGASITQRPDLYRVAYIGAPDLDMVRFYAFTTHNNMPALLEYGDASRKEEFDAIVQYSPYQNIKDGTRYPRVMVQTGMNDTRVPPWQARKFAARLLRATTSGEPVILYHDLRSGHAGGRSITSSIDMATKEMDFLFNAVR